MNIFNWLNAKSGSKTEDLAKVLVLVTALCSVIALGAWIEG